MNLTISEYQPTTELRLLVQSYWSGNFNLSGEREFAQSVVPNGCIELIIHLSDAHCSLTRFDGTCWLRSPQFTLLGLYTQPYEVKFSTNVKVFGIRFFPDGIRNIFGVPPSEFLATFEDGVDVLGRSFKDFCNRLREIKTLEEQVKIADSFLTNQLKSHYQSHDYTHQAMDLIRKAAGITDYRDITSLVPISDRQLQREFKNQYGITVGEYMRLARLNSIQNYMQSNNLNFTQLSYELQFSDQSHFIREFKHYVGMSPGKFRKARSKFIVNPV